MEFMRYPARDGLQIPAYLTLPRNGNGKNLPTIVLIGESPTARSAFWAWQPHVQFLASRGYAVIQPQMRGTPGFGLAYRRAGHKQLDLGIQDDVADGVKWAIAQGIADPSRVCIIGTSKGAYTALSALHKDAGLFRCAVGISALGALPAALKQPVLLAFGAQDPVMAAEGKKLADALRANGNAQVEFQLYDEHGQDWSLAANRIDLWTRIEQFLARHTGQR
jgi:dipeptidyl aminopeptidase/acylaminoacyl peptidase